MKTDGWLIFYWSLIVIGFALSFARVSGTYGIPFGGGLLVIIGTLCLETHSSGKKDKKDKIEE
jgi:hypothetical protein